MMLLRSLIATDPKLFGRRRPFTFDIDVISSPPAFVADLKLFATAFIGGFLFVAVYLA